MHGDPHAPETGSSKTFTCLSEARGKKLFMAIITFRKEHISVVTQPCLTPLCLFDDVSRV